MDASLAARLELEVLDRIGDVDFVPLDAGVFEDRVENLAGRADKRLACDVLLVAGLFADKDDLCILRPFAEHGLCGVAPRAGSGGRISRPRATRPQ